MKSRPIREFSKAEKKAVDEELCRHFAEATEKHYTEIDAMVLYYVRQRTGWGKKKLKDFYKDFVSSMEELQKRYEMSSTPDTVWLCTQMLKREGIDIEAWYKEFTNS